MRVDKVVVGYMFQYAEAEFEFSPGINIIVGPNGSGKTNLLNCIKFALIGVLPFKKDQCLNVTFAHEVPDAWVEMTFHHFGEHFIKRSLTRSSKTEISSNAAQIKGAAQTTAAVLELLGVNEAYIHNHVFVPQGNLRAFIDSTPNDRLRVINSVLDLDLIEDRWKALGDYINANSAYDTLDYAEQLNELAQCRFELESTFHEDEGVIKHQEDLTNKLDVTLAMLNRVKAEMTAIKNKLEEKKNILDDLVKDTKFVQDARLEAFIPLAPQIRKYYVLKEQLTYAWKHRAPFVPFMDEHMITLVEKRISEINSLTGFYARAEETVADSNECLLCGSEVTPDVIHARIHKSRTDLINEREQLREDLNLLHDAKNKRALYERSVAEIKQLVKWLRGIKEVLGNDFPTEQELDAYIEARKRYEKVLADSKSLTDEIKELTDKLASLSANVASLEEKVAQYRSEIVFDRNVLSTERKKLERKKELRAKIAGLVGFEKEQRKIMEKRRRLDVLRQVRAIFHRSNLTAKLVQRYVDELSAKMNALLEKIDMNFRVTMTPEMHCEVQYYDGRVISEKSLSYGEQLALALCYHLSTNMARGLNFVVLDEPTLGLDEYRVTQVPSLLSKFMEAQDQDFQIICCTHERELLKCADNVIDLGAQQR